MTPRELPAGTVLHRIHDRAYAGPAFNRCRGKPGRFSPLRDAGGVCIPSLYAAESFDGAVYETILHDVDLTDPLAQVPRQAIDHLAHSRLEARRALRLAPLFRPELAALGLGRDVLFRPTASAHAACRDLALRLHAAAEGHDGLLWTSVRDDAGRAVLLFGDRVAARDLRLAESRDVRSSAALLDDIAAAFRRAGVTLLR